MPYVANSSDHRPLFGGRHPFPSCRLTCGSLFGDTAICLPGPVAILTAFSKALSKGLSIATPSLGIQTSDPVITPGALLPPEAPL